MRAKVKRVSVAVNRSVKITSAYGRKKTGYTAAMAGKSSMGSRARRRREELNLSKTELAQKISALGKPVVIQHIRHLENEEPRTISYLAELAEVLGVDPLWLQTGKKRRRKTPINSELLAASCAAANVIIDEHNLDFDDVRRMDLAVRIYQEIEVSPGGTPGEAAKSALLDLLASLQKAPAA